MIEAEGATNCTLSVYAQPGERSSQIVGRHGDALKVRVSAPPEDGRANKALVALLAEALGAPVRDVTVVAGASHRRKRIRIAGWSADAVATALQPYVSEES